jgi:uncharacterized sulfatase
MLELAGEEVPATLDGRSLAPALRDPRVSIHDHIMISWHRSSFRGGACSGFYPIRCVTDGRYKLAVNLFDTDELYDLERDPHELVNQIDSPDHAGVRDALHDRLIAELSEANDPLRAAEWADRPWRASAVGPPPAGRGGPRRGFPFERPSLGVNDKLRPGDKVGWA